MNNSNNDFIDLTNLEEARTGTHIIIDYVSCTFPFIMHADDYELFVVEDILCLVTEELGYKREDAEKDDYSLNRYLYQYTIGASITLRLIGPELKSGHPSCQIELKGEGCREWERHNPDKTWKDFMEFFLIRLNGKPTRIDLTIDDYDGKDVDLDFIRYKMDNNFYTTTFRDKKYIIHGNDEYGFTVALGSHESTQELCIYEKNKEQKRKKGYCVQPYWLRYEMRFRREKAYDACMCLVENDPDNYSNIFYGLLYEMLDLKEDNTYDDNNQYKIATDPRWQTFLNNVSKCKLKKYPQKIESSLERYLEWASDIASKFFLLSCVYYNDLDDAIYVLLENAYKQKLSKIDYKRLKQYFSLLSGEPKTTEDEDNAKEAIEKRLKLYHDLKF